MIAAPFLALGLALAFTPEPAPAELPMDVGPEASDRFEDYAMCLAERAYARRSDRRSPALLAAEVRSDCASRKARAAEALAAAYRRDPALLRPGQDPEARAAELLGSWDVRIEWVFAQARRSRDEE
jgi:DNA primase large subunit